MNYDYDDDERMNEYNRIIIVIRNKKKTQINLNNPFQLI